MHPNQLDLVPPTNDEVFVHLCIEIWRREWSPDSIQANGRRGQGQAGVDIIARKGDTYSGIQCKVRSHQGKTIPDLSEADIREEVKKALSFQPPLKHLIIATTAPNDEKAQEIARQITVENAKHGLFPVDVVGWGELRRLIDRHPEVYEWYNGLGPIENKLEKKIDATQETINEILAAVKNGNGELFDILIRTQIDTARSLVDAHKPNAAIDLLNSIMKAVGEKLSFAQKYRIYSNLGNAKLLLDEAEQAGKNFIEAAKFAVEEDKAIAQEAFGYFLVKDYNRAQEIAEKGILSFPQSGRLRTIVMLGLYEKDKTLNPEELIPSGFENDEHVAYSVARLLAMQRKGDEAAYWMRKAYEKDPNNWQFKKAFAETLLQRASDGGIFVHGGAADLQADFVEAEKLLEEIWKIVSQGEPIKASAEIAAETVIVRKAKRNISGAKEVCAAGLGMGETPLLLQAAAQLAAEEKDYQKAIDFYKKIDLAIVPERDFLIAHCQLSMDNADGAIETLLTAAQSSIPKDLKEISLAQALQFQATKNGPANVLPQLEELVVKEPNSIPYRLAYSAVLRQAKNKSKSLVEAEAARNLLTPDSEMKHRAAVADLFLKLDEFDDAVQILIELAPNPVDSPLKRQLLTALYNADARAGLRKQLDELPQQQKTDPFYLRLEIAFQKRIGNHTEALQLLSNYLDKYPEDAELRLQWINLLERQGKKEQLLEYLSKNEDLLTGTGMQRISYAHVLLRNEMHDQAFSVGYDATRRNMGDPEILLAYVGLVLFVKSYKPFEETTVAPDYGFILEPEEGGKQTSYVIQTDEIIDRAIELGSSHPIAQSVLGKKKDDIIEVFQNPYTATRHRVMSVRHKMLMLSDEILETFNTRFPEHRGFYKIPVSKKPDGSFDDSALFKLAEEKHLHGQKIADDIKQQPFPIPVIASLHGLHPIRTWANMTQDENDGVRSCFGNTDELKNAHNILNNNNGFILDPITLNLIDVLNLKDPLVKLGKPLYITRSTVENIHVLAQDLSRHEEGMQSLGQRDNKLALYEVSGDAIKAELTRLTNMLEWAKNNCIEVPALSETDVPPVARQLAQAVAPAFMDTIIAAKDKDFVLLSDDLYYRQMAEIMGVRGTWIQPLLQHMHNLGLIDERKHNDTVARLVLFNHRFTAISASVLLQVTKDEDYQLTQKVQKIIKSTLGATIEFRSGATVLVNFLLQLIDSGVPKNKRPALFAFILSTIEEYYPQPLDKMYAELYEIVNKRYPSNDFANMKRRQEWKGYADDWYSDVKSRRP